VPARSDPPTLITAETIMAGDPPQAGPTALIATGGRISWVGSANEIPHPVPRRRVDLGGSVVMPGFVDCHFHMLFLLPTAGWADLRGASSVEAARQVMAAHASTLPEGRWLVGWGFDASKTKGRRLLRRELDLISPDTPAMIIESSLHQGSINTAALAVVGWGRSTPRWPGGELTRDRRGEPTGMVWERAFGVPALKAVEADIAGSPDLIPTRLRSMSVELLSQGITHVAEAFTPPRLANAFEATGLALGLTMLPTSGRGLYSSPWDALEGRRTGDGDARLGVGPMKLVADGAERGAMSLPVPAMLRMTATALTRGLRSRDFDGFRVLGGSGSRLQRGLVRTGIPHYSRTELAEITAAALANGFRVAIHALGNDALDMALSAFEEARRSSGVDVTGCRIEHAMFGRPADFQRASRLGLILSMQPGHAAQYASTLRLTALDTLFEPVPIRWALDAGCRVAISSDGPTVPGTPLDNLRTAVDRIGVEGKPVAQNQAISKVEALRAITVGGAEACGLEDMKGSIAVGKQADFAVLSGDPFDKSTKVLETWVAGAKAWPATST
jgi:predicted amidohydrolase YtcJ